MKLIFYFMGIIARMAEQLRRISINGLSLLLGLVFLSFIFSYRLLNDNDTTLKNESTGYVLLFIGSVFLISWLFGHKFFHPSHYIEKTVSPVLDNLFGTGKFDLNNTHTKKFFIVPGSLIENESGELLFASNVDASDSIVGINTGNKKGIWTMELLNFNPRLTTGYLYWGFKRYPTLKIRYRLPNNPFSTVVYLSSTTESEINKLTNETSEYFKLA